MAGAAAAAAGAGSSPSWMKLDSESGAGTFDNSWGAAESRGEEKRMICIYIYIYILPACEQSPSLVVQEDSIDPPCVERE